MGSVIPRRLTVLESDSRPRLTHGMNRSPQDGKLRALVIHLDEIDDDAGRNHVVQPGGSDPDFPDGFRVCSVALTPEAAAGGLAGHLRNRITPRHTKTWVDDC